MIVIEGYYDQNDYNDPIKYRVNYEYSNYFTFSEIDITIIRVQRNIVNMLDGTTRMFFTTRMAGDMSSAISFINPFVAYFLLDNEYTSYNQHINYQISATGRRLESQGSSDKEKKEKVA